MFCRLRSYSHWPAKFVDERVGLRIGQHPPHLLLEHRRLVQLALRGEVEQLVVGNAAPEEERQPRRQLEIADAVHRAGRDARPDRARRGSTNFGLARIRCSAI